MHDLLVEGALRPGNDPERRYAAGHHHLSAAIKGDPVHLVNE
jgi:hypothetical protein